MGRVCGVSSKRTSFASRQGYIAEIFLIVGLLKAGCCRSASTFQWPLSPTPVIEHFDARMLVVFIRCSHSMVAVQDQRCARRRLEVKRLFLDSRSLDIGCCPPIPVYGEAAHLVGSQPHEPAFLARVKISTDLRMGREHAPLADLDFSAGSLLRPCTWLS